MYNCEILNFNDFGSNLSFDILKKLNKFRVSQGQIIVVTDRWSRFNNKDSFSRELEAKTVFVFDELKVLYNLTVYKLGVQILES